MKRLVLILLSVCLAIPLASRADDPVNDLFKQAQTANDQRRYDDAVLIYERILKEHPEKIDARSGIADALMRKAQQANEEKRYDDAEQIYERLIIDYPERSDAHSGIAEYLFRKAQKAYEEKRYDDALHLYEQILTEHPERVDNWYSVERSIVDILIRKGDLAEAAKAVHLCLDTAPNPEEFNNVCGFAANILSALDKNVDRANQFVAFQQPGAAAGAVNPMDAVGYPTQPEREAAFATMREKAGDTPTASRIRAYTFLLTGKPKEAFAQFADGFRRASNFSDLQVTSRDLATVALTAVHGRLAGVDTAIRYVIFGPNGPDGKPNTPDDLADPFAELLPDPPAPGEGGLAGLNPDELAALRKVRDASLLYARDSGVHDGLRFHAFVALRRTNDALDNWGIAGQKEWFFQYAFEYGNLESVLPGLLAAARGRVLNFGGDYPMLAEIAARLAAGKGPKQPNGIEKAREQFNQMIDPLQKINFPKSALNPLKQPATF